MIVKDTKFIVITKLMFYGSQNNFNGVQIIFRFCKFLRRRIFELFIESHDRSQAIILWDKTKLRLRIVFNRLVDAFLAVEALGFFYID